MQSGDWREWSRHILSTLESLSKNIEKLHAEQIEQSKTLLRNTLTVEEHHKRSTMLEEELKRIENDVGEVKDHVTRVEGVGKAVRWTGYTAAAITAVIGALKALGVF